MFLPNPGILAAGAGVAPVGQQLFTTSGSFIVPADVTRICIVAIGAGAKSVWDGIYNQSGGGGGLAYSNGIAVTPGESLSIDVPASNGGLVRLRRGSTTLLSASNATDGFGGVGLVGQVLRRGGGSGGWDERDINGSGAAGYTSDGQNPETPEFSPRGGGGTSPYGGGGGAQQGAAPGAVGGVYGGGGASGVRAGGPGCLRIIWGEGRAFPNTNTGDL